MGRLPCGSAQPVAAVLRPQVRGRNMLNLVQVLYQSREYAPVEMQKQFEEWITIRSGPNWAPLRFG